MTTLNCKPGQMAIVKPPTSGGFCAMTDMIVEVVELCLPFGNHIPDLEATCSFTHAFDAPIAPAWVVRTSRPMETMREAATGERVLSLYTWMWDGRLRPINAPDNATDDESSSYLPPVPSITTKTKEIA